MLQHRLGLQAGSFLCEVQIMSPLGLLPEQFIDMGFQEVAANCLPLS